MRKIEQHATHAMKEGHELRQGNTTVRKADSYSGGMIMYLHGHAIARFEPEGVSISLAKHNTVTTRSRVNAVLQAFNIPWRVRTVAYVAVLENIHTGRTAEPFYYDEWYRFDADTPRMARHWSAMTDRQDFATPALGFAFAKARR